VKPLDLSKLPYEEKIAFLSSEQFISIFSKLSPDQLKYVTNDQLKNLDLASLTIDQFQSLFLFNRDAKIALLSPEQLYAITDKLNTRDLMVVISADQVKNLNLASLTTDQIKELFTFHADTKIPSLSPEQLASIFSKLKYYHLEHVTIDQFKKLNPASLTTDQINSLLSRHRSEKIAFLSSEQLHGFLRGYLHSDIKCAIKKRLEVLGQKDNLKKDPSESP
jgi:hypothetical protein